MAHEYEYYSWTWIRIQLSKDIIRIHSVFIIHIYEYYSVLHSTSLGIIKALQKAAKSCKIRRTGSNAQPSHPWSLLRRWEWRREWVKSEKGTIMHNQLCNEILINKGDHCSHQCQFPHWGLAHEDYFCAQTFGIFEYSRILYFCSILNTNTLSCVHLKYEYIFMRHPAE